MLLLFLVLLYFSLVRDPTRKKNIWNAKIIQATPQNSHIIKIYFQFLAVLFPHFSLFVLSHSPKCFFFVTFRQPAIKQQALKINWRQFKVRMKSLSCNYNNDTKKSRKRHLSTQSSSSSTSSAQFCIQTLHSTKLKRFHEILNEWKYFYCHLNTFFMNRCYSCTVKCLEITKTH